ncbi:hypothetical protein CTEN210_02767 [Chaetoceros tenuissimus]|uniref:Nucleotide-diphospho-sugar transferase domain-containing protein n=1 Tax=Chaetoceros tenuissimus TaxID=426638 RepID=A0AAD3H161_9STRA|nr:hypothetical protein CTEN210_02767 [Chaetoceros tenuissimus]
MRNTSMKYAIVFGILLSCYIIFISNTQLSFEAETVFQLDTKDDSLPTKAIHANPVQKVVSPIHNSTKDALIKIVAFTSVDFLPMAKHWYNRLTELGYTTHVLVLIDEQSIQEFTAINQDNTDEYYRFEIQLVEKGTKRKDMVQSLWYHRILYCVQQLKLGTSLLVSDTDVVFQRYIPIEELSHENYDVMLAEALMFPKHVFEQQGFVFCGCLTFLKATKATLTVWERLLEQCDGGTKRCDDQVEMNVLLAESMEWDSEKALANKAKDGLVQDEFTGRSKVVPDFKANVWDRDFAWRGPLDTDVCPTENNWVSMPGNIPNFNNRILDGRAHGRGDSKLARVKVWEKFCGKDGTNRNPDVETSIEDRLRQAAAKAGYTAVGHSKSNISIMEEKKIEISSKIRAIVHMGPHKTGTSSIQDASKKFQNELLKDGYEMPWAIAIEDPNVRNRKPNAWIRQAHNQVRFAKCFIPQEKSENKFPCIEDLLSAGHEIAKKRRNVLISTEFFDEIDPAGIDKLMTYLSPWDEVKIVIYYRHFYSWIYSDYNQLVKDQKLRDQNFVDFIQKNPLFAKHMNMTHAAPLIKRLKASGIRDDDIIIINMHDKNLGGPVESFYCHDTINTPNTCEAVRNEKEIASNGSISLDEIHLAYAAIDASLYKFKRKMIPPAVLKQIREKISTSTIELKRKCIGNDDAIVNMLWEKSLEYKNELFPSHATILHSSLEEEKMRLDFEKSFEKAFCWVDTGDALSQDSWKEFFKKL